MTTPAWPVSLPEFVQEQGYGESLPDTRIESEVDDGPTKVRRRFTTNHRPIQCELWCTEDQAADFEDFYMDDLRGGTREFTWVNPSTQAAKTFRFRGPPPSFTRKGEAVIYRLTLWQLN